MIINISIEGEKIIDVLMRMPNWAEIERAYRQKEQERRTALDRAYDDCEECGGPCRWEYPGKYGNAG